MFKTFLGIGILATPAAFGQMGLAGGIIGLVIIGIMNMYTMQLQIESKLKVNANIVSYSDLSGVVLGPKG